VPQQIPPRSRQDLPGSSAPGCCWNAWTAESTTSSASWTTCASRPRSARPNATGAAETRQEISGRLRSKKSPATGTPSVATYPPPPSTAKTSSQPSAASLSETP